MVYKTILRAIVNRLKPLLLNLIAPTQCSFVPGWQITDSVVIIQEVLYDMRCKKGKRGTMMTKLDLEKAYDSLKWNFIRDTLIDVGLSPSFVGIIMRCVSSPSMNVMWNGVRTKTFTPTRDIQRDTLPPICLFFTLSA